MRLFALSASLLLCLAGIAHAHERHKWVGEMHQTGQNNEHSYPMSIVVHGARGVTEYPTLACGGVLTRVGRVKGGYSVYHERITHGRLTADKPEGCVDGVLIVAQKKGQFTVGWFGAFEDGPMMASAVLEREAK